MSREFLGGSSALAAVTVKSLNDGSASGVPATTRHLNQTELAGRWRVSERTLERWRWRKIGPSYLKVGGRVVYRLVDVLAFEKARLLGPTRPADPFFTRDDGRPNL
jgi:hypothetical protein